MVDIVQEIFSFPDKIPNFETCPNKDDKICIVTLIGKSNHDVHKSKAAVFNTILDRDIFPGPQKGDASTEHKNFSIQGYYDSSNSVMYLHLVTQYDTTTLCRLCELAELDLKSKGSVTFCQSQDFDVARCLLFLFTVSHIVVLSHPGSSFDIGFVRLFRTLDSIRSKIQVPLSDFLKSFPISKDWVQAGRPCSPRVLFVFEKCTLELTDNDFESPSKSRSQRTSPIKRLQHAIEDQIYRILRKSRIITNISNNSLFAVPANQEFVFVHTQSVGVGDPVNFYMNLLTESCAKAKDAESPLSRTFQAQNYTNTMNLASLSLSNGDLSPKSTLQSKSNMGGSFKEFLWQHVELALTKGFNDNVGRNPPAPIFELPSLRLWKIIASSLYDFFLTDENKARHHFNTLKSLLEIDTRFADSRCNKVIPIAETAYQEGLPKHYTKSMHLSKLSQAKRVFAQHARGPVFDKYMKQLEETCELLWKSGRQLCEVVSMTGNPCVHELHRLPGTEETDENRNVPVKSHCSQVKTKAACNCGRKQGERDDPFDHRAANFGFYQNLERQCCEKRDHHIFPVFMPSTTDAKATGLNTSKEETVVEPTQERKVSKTDSVSGTGSNLSSGMSLGGQSSADNEDDLFDHDGHLSQTSHAVVPDVTHEENRNGTNKPLNRMASTTEYLAGMIHSQNPPGLLPKFSSWSLCCLDNSSAYSPTHGLDLPGFVHGCHYLLPWEVTVKADKEKWPALSEPTGGKKGKNRKGQKTLSEPLEVVIRFYLGCEYECPRGHRYFCSGPEKVLKVSGGGPPKDNANKLVNNDMPLYFPCPVCRGGKGYLGQLMRIYVATPDSPVKGVIRPRVQPSIPPCPIFYPAADEEILLQPKGIWVLRLPFIYISDNGPYGIPTEQHHLIHCRIMKGLFGIEQTKQT